MDDLEVDDLMVMDALAIRLGQSTLERRSYAVVNVTSTLPHSVLYPHHFHVAVVDICQVARTAFVRLNLCSQEDEKKNNQLIKKQDVISVFISKLRTFVRFHIL